MRDCQPPGQGEALLISKVSSSMSCVKMLARSRAARLLSLLLYEYGGSTDFSVVVSPAGPHTYTGFASMLGCPDRCLMNAAICNGLLASVWCHSTFIPAAKAGEQAACTTSSSDYSNESCL